jgi:hypothetical protein
VRDAGDRPAQQRNNDGLLLERHCIPSVLVINPFSHFNIADTHLGAAHLPIAPS